MVVVRFGTEQSVIYHVEEEKFRSAVLSRVYFKGQPQTSNYLPVEGAINAQRMNSGTHESCVNVTVYIKVCLSRCTCILTSRVLASESWVKYAMQMK